MSVSFLLQSTALSARTRTVLAYADALAACGIAVRIVTADEPVRWRSSRAEWIEVERLDTYRPASDERIVSSTRELVESFENGVQLLFGGEDPDTIAPRARKIAASRPALQTGGSETVYAGPVVDEEIFRAQPARENTPLRVLLAGASQAEHKGIDDGYGAVAHARWFHQKLDLVRVAPWAPSREEPLDSVQEFHVALNTREMTRLLHSCDVLLVPSHREEGFGLIATEGLAAGVAAVMTATELHGSFDEQRDYALFAPERNAVELGERLIELLGDGELRERLRSRGPEVAQQWRSELVGERLRAVLSSES